MPATARNALFRAIPVMIPGKAIGQNDQQAHGVASREGEALEVQAK